MVTGVVGGYQIPVSGVALTSVKIYKNAGISTSINLYAKNRHAWNSDECQDHPTADAGDGSQRRGRNRLSRPRRSVLDFLASAIILSI